MTLKIGILSDTHGSTHPEIIALINQCDIALHAGDIINEKDLKALQPKQQLIAVQGNNDAHITQLKLIEELNLAQGKIVMEHGHKHGHYQPDHDLLRSTHPDAKVIIYGHTHKQVIDNQKTPWVINPGAAGKVRNHGGSKCLVIEIKNTEEWLITPFIFDQN